MDSFLADGRVHGSTYIYVCPICDAIVPDVVSQSSQATKRCGSPFCEASNNIVVHPGDAHSYLLWMSHLSCKNGISQSELVISMVITQVDWEAPQIHLARQICRWISGIAHLPWYFCPCMDFRLEYWIEHITMARLFYDKLFYSLLVYLTCLTKQRFFFALLMFIHTYIYIYHNISLYIDILYSICFIFTFQIVFHFCQVPTHSIFPRSFFLWFLF